jgi:hypothetical protein
VPITPNSLDTDSTSTIFPPSTCDGLEDPVDGVNLAISD